MLAAAFRRSEIVELLLKAGAKVNDQDELGLTAIDWATDSAETVALLRTPIAVSEPTPVPRVTRVREEPTPYVTPSVQRSVEDTELTGLAAAILRDRKPRSATGQIQETSERQVPEPDLELTGDDSRDATDDTLDQPFGTIPEEDTIATARRPGTQRRIFDLSSPPPKPVSKVDIHVPGLSPSHSSRSAVIVWALVFIVLAAGGYGGYRLATSFLAQRQTNAAATTPSTTPSQPPPVTKRQPVVGGDVVGAELHVPDAIFPPSSEVKEGSVTVAVRVSRKGIVVAAKAMDGDESLREAAIEAAEGSAFSPDKLQDKPLMDGTITYHFVSPELSKSTKTESSNGTANKPVSIVIGGPLDGT
jgi:hypothetical protein